MLRCDDSVQEYRRLSAHLGDARDRTDLFGSGNTESMGFAVRTRQCSRTKPSKSHYRGKVHLRPARTWCQLRSAPRGISGVICNASQIARSIVGVGTLWAHKRTLHVAGSSTDASCLTHSELDISGCDRLYRDVQGCSPVLQGQGQEAHDRYERSSIARSNLAVSLQ